MIYVNFAKYIGDQDKIAQLRPKHRKYLADLLKCGRLAGAGPFTDGSGTLIIYNVETLEEAQAIVAADPFTTNGVFTSCDLRPWKIVFSNAEALASVV